MGDSEKQPSELEQDRHRGRPQTWRQRWAVTSLPNKLMATATVAIAIAAVVNLVVAIGQWMILSRQLDQMAGASNYAERQAILAIGQLNVANRNVLYAQQQADAAQKGVAAIQRQMRQDQRAWIKAMTGNRPVDFKIGYPVQSSVDLTNIGKTAAQKVRIEVVAEKLTIDEAPSLTFRKGHIGITTVGDIYPDPPLSIPIVWAQSYDREGQPVKEILQYSDFQDLRDGKTYFVFYGRIRYVDIFEVSHETKFCAFNSASRLPITINAKRCTDYNGVDNN